MMSTHEEKTTNADPTALVKHIATFADDSGYVDYNSMMDKLVNEWHLEKKEAKQIAQGVMWMAYFTGVKGVTIFGGKFLPQDALGLTHPWDSALFDRYTGAFNQELFAVLLNQFFITDEDGVKIISHASMNQFLKEHHAVDHRWDDASYFFKMLGKTGNKGEFDLFFEKCVSRWKKNAAGELEGYITQSDFEQFYLNTKLIAEKVKTNILPQKKPEECKASPLLVQQGIWNSSKITTTTTPAPSVEPAKTVHLN
ncbi:MAG TPA: hypothetical protein VHM20_04440 [Gammaproteobacteria bacterium]|jgi:hypothetical protein|nr:hypothetical protein [Gammaproteobacteria bacterium]